MSANSSPEPQAPTTEPAADLTAPHWLSQHQWIPFVLPLAVFMLVGYFAPQSKPNLKPPQSSSAAPVEAGPTAEPLSPDAAGGGAAPIHGFVRSRSPPPC